MSMLTRTGRRYSLRPMHYRLRRFGRWCAVFTIDVVFGLALVFATLGLAWVGASSLWANL